MLRRYLKFGCTSEKQSSCTRKPFKFHSALYAVAFSALGRGFIRATYLVEQSLCHFLSFTLIIVEKALGTYSSPGSPKLQMSDRVGNFEFSNELNPSLSWAST